MTVELRPLGVHCNIACQYCYQNPQRDAGNLGKRYDIETMKRAILEEGGLSAEQIDRLFASGAAR